VEPAFNLGLLLQEVGELETAIVCFERAAETKPTTALSLVSSSRHAPRISIWEIANLAKRDASSVALSVRAWLTLCGVYRSLGYQDKAETFCRRALEHNPQSVPALMCWPTCSWQRDERTKQACACPVA